MKNLGKCQVKGCYRPAVYALYKRSPDGQKVWLYVCEHHEQMIGDENMRWAKQHVDFVIETQLAPQSVVTPAETRAKLSASSKKHWQDPEYRVKQIATHTGRHPSPETKAKISASLTRRR